MKKILITLILTFQITFSFSQDYTIDVTAKSKNDYKISGEDLNGNIEGLDIVQALVWSSAGGSLKTDPAGVWWDSMPFSERINYADFVNNQQTIESEWGSDFGDRKIELVFIGQQLDVSAITNKLDECLLNQEEVSEWKDGKLQLTDNWPVSN